MDTRIAVPARSMFIPSERARTANLVALYTLPPWIDLIAGKAAHINDMSPSGRYHQGNNEAGNIEEALDVGIVTDRCYRAI